MKLKILVLSFFSICLFSCGDDDAPNFTVDCLPANLQTGVIAFYPFNGGSLADESGNSNDLSNPTTAASTTDRNGNADCAYEFDNMQTAEEFLTTASSNFLDGLSEFSISLWYQPIDTTRDGGSYEVLLGRGDEARCPDRRGEWSVGLYDCRRAVFGHNNSVWANRISNPFGCQEEINGLTGNWHHVVAVLNGDEYKIYFNGNLENSATGNANCSPLHLAEDIGDLFLGNNYTGKIDDVLICDRKISQQEISELFVNEPCCQ